jgi:hypothetical protein
MRLSPLSPHAVNSSVLCPRNSGTGGGTGTVPELPPGTPLARDRRPDYDRGEVKFLSVLDSASLYWFSLLSKRFLPKSL